MTQSLTDPLIQKTVFLNLKGQLNSHNALSFKKNIFNIPEDKKFLVLDLMNLHSITGEGIKVFFESIKYFQKREGIVILISPKEEVFLLLKFLKLLNYVIVVENYQKAKEVIESYLIHKGVSQQFFVEELPFADLFQEELKSSNKEEQNILSKNIQYYQNIAKNKNPTDEEIRQLKENLHFAHQKLSSINERIQKQNEVNLNQEDIFQFIENKIAEIKKSNESYFQEFHTRLHLLEDSQEEVKTIIEELKKDVGQIKSVLLKENTDLKDSELQKEQVNDIKIKKIDGYYILSCQSCGQPLRIKQFGKHICPKCKAEFSVLPKGEVKFFEHS